MQHITHTQPFYGSLGFVRDNPGEPIPDEPFTHSPNMVINHPLSATSIYYNPWHPLCSIYVHDSLFHNLSPSFLWSTSWPGLRFVPSVLPNQRCWAQHSHFTAIIHVHLF